LYIELTNLPLDAKKKEEKETGVQRYLCILFLGFCIIIKLREGLLRPFAWASSKFVAVCVANLYGQMMAFKVVIESSQQYVLDQMTCFSSLSLDRCQRPFLFFFLFLILGKRVVHTKIQYSPLISFVFRFGPSSYY